MKLATRRSDKGFPIGREAGCFGSTGEGVAMADSTIKKVSERTAPKGAMGQTYLASGKRVAMRLWRNEQPHEKQSDRRDYETVGFVVSGRAELTLEGQVITLEPGDSWLVPADAEHRYRVIEPFTAVEATAPPAQVHGRDEK
jgi:quercetin dioxygenase-like cupin family protein